jgi:dihydroorotate dehydrogenase
MDTGVFYDPLRSYEENYAIGPFCNFENKKKTQDPLSPPQFYFFGQKVNLPFGIPAGPLLNSNYIKAAFDKGFDIAVYKTVRSESYPSHPFPNVLGVHIQGNLTLERAKEPILADTNYTKPISITNSFGVPSKDPSIWQEDVRTAMSYVGKGQVLVLSFMGTVKQNQTEKDFISDFVLAAQLAHETGVPILEGNLSCPNIGNEGLVCYNLEMTRKIVNAVRDKIGEIPLIWKVGYYESDKQLSELAKIAHESKSSLSVINTIPGIIIDRNGKQALPGSPARLKSGVCGAAIKWAGIDMVKRLHAIRSKEGYNFSIDGVGGVVSPTDYFDYKRAGADGVFSATGAMWNAGLAYEIKKEVKNRAR